MNLVCHCLSLIGNGERGFFIAIQSDLISAQSIISAYNCHMLKKQSKAKTIKRTCILVIVTETTGFLQNLFFPSTLVMALRSVP